MRISTPLPETHIQILRFLSPHFLQTFRHVFKPVAVCCSVLQCAAVRCSALRVAVCCSVLQCAAVCCSVLQYSAVLCSMVQRGAVWCSVVQCVTVCCSVLRCIQVHNSTIEGDDREWCQSVFATVCSLCVCVCVHVHVRERGICNAQQAPKTRRAAVDKVCCLSAMHRQSPLNKRTWQRRRVLIVADQGSY